ncbi:MAG: polysaccharide biosynthesis tyrosine autokinase [Bacteroidia bacterium]|nr:polysaccharide biosynthesis tyrosine autokinase [Bacteroidia bacterium]
MSYHVGLDKTDFVKQAEAKLTSAVDVGLVFYLIKKYKWIILLTFIISGTLAFLYLRYSQPIYESKTLLQINDNKADQLLRLSSMDEADNLIAEAIEQIHSKVFLKRVVEKLDITVNYYSEGTFKNNELYKSSPFLVKVNLKNKSLEGVEFYVEFNADMTSGKIKYNGTSKDFKLNTWLNSADFDVNVFLNPEIPETTIIDVVKKNKAFYFVVRNSDAVTAELQGKVQVKVINELAKTILISVKDINAMKVAEIVNTIAEEYLNYDVERKSESSRNILNFIDTQLGLVYNDLKNTESDLKKFKQEKNIDINKEKLTSDLFRANTIDDQLLKVELEEKIIEEVQKNISSNKNIDIYQLISIISGTEYESMIKDVIQNIQKLLNAKETLLYSVTPNAENIKQIDYQLENQKKLLLESLSAVRLRYKTSYKSLLERAADYKYKMGSTPEDEVELSRLNRLYTISEKYYTMLLEKKTEFSISKAGYVSKNIILEKGSSSGAKVFPNSRNIVIVSVVASLLISLLILVIFYISHNKIYSISDVMKYSTQGVSLIGVVPRLQSSIPVSQLIVDKNPKSVISESFRTIRTNLSFINNEPGSKIISISSTISGEGKTFVAINIAGIFAFTGKKVVLIDLDLRKPKIHKGFGVKNDVGMSNLLTGEHQLEECLHNTTIEGLKFITAGPTPPNPSELILSDKLKQIITQLKGMFDYVVIDNAPVGLVTDGIETLRNSDYPIYVFRADYSEKFFIQNLIRLKTENQITKLCAVLNDMDMNKKLYGYNYGYNYIYGYGEKTGYYSDIDDVKKRKRKKD